MSRLMARAIVLSCVSVAVSLVAVSATHAAPVIDVITMPITGATYDAQSGNFSISGRPNGITSIFYNDSRVPNPVTNDFVVFDLSTVGLQSLVSTDGQEINYNANGSFGDLTLLDGNNGFATLLQGELVHLRMKIEDPSIGAFKGEGGFNVTGGSLASEIGNNGAFATFGISFVVPTTFKSSFGALANTKLFPHTTPAPLPSAAWAGLVAVGALGIGRKRIRQMIGM